MTTILKNRMYCGDMVQGRYRMKSYKVHVQEVVPEDEWYIVENTHEAIIDRKPLKKYSGFLFGTPGRGPSRKSSICSAAF